MGDNSSIEWTDATWNPVRGCSRLSPGCGGANHQGGCYAEKIAARFSGPGQPFEGFAERTAHGGRWTGKIDVVWPMVDQPIRWRKPRRIFANSMSDLFHKDLPRDDVAVIYGTAIAAVHLRGHTFQILTKRADHMRELLNDEEFWEIANAHASSLVLEHTDPLARRSDDARATCREYGPDVPPPGIWLGVSVEDQARADERIPDLLATPAAIRFLSCEPLLGPVDLMDVIPNPISWSPVHGMTRVLDWVIAGGESGPSARPMHLDWARALRDQCAVVGVPFFFKQWGEWLAGENLSAQPGSLAQWQDGEVGQHSTCKDRPDGKAPEWRHFGVVGQPGAFALRVGKKAAGAELDGKLHREFPT